MRIKITYLLLLFVLFNYNLNAQNTSSETVEFQMLQQPKVPIENNLRTFKATVTSPYNLTADDVIKESKANHEKALKNYDNVVLESQKEFNQKTKDYESETVKAKQKFETESAEFKKLSLLERMTITDQGKNPRLVNPAKPEYVKPAPPVYREPNLNDYLIVDNAVLASQINIDGFTKDNSYLTISLDIQPVHFQDNAGQTFANQPTKLIVKMNGAEKINTTFFQEFKFLSSSPSNNINKPSEEKNHLNMVMKFINQYLNETYGYQTVKRTVKLQNVKNKGKYDDLERAGIYVATNLKKLQPDDPEINTIAFANMQKGLDIWSQTLSKIEYKNSKSDFNAKIAQFVYFNLIRVNLAMNNKTEAEKYLNQLQENLVYIKLSYDEEKELSQLEKEIYKLKK